MVLTQSFGTPAYLHWEGIRDVGWSPSNIFLLRLPYLVESLLLNYIW